jgi:hypothetical protein
MDSDTGLSHLKHDYIYRVSLTAWVMWTITNMKDNWTQSKKNIKNTTSKNEESIKKNKKN